MQSLVLTDSEVPSSARRRWRLVLAGIFLLTRPLHVRAGNCTGADPQAILKKLLESSYRRSVRPNHTGPPTRVQVQLDIQSLVAVNPKLHYFEVMGYWRTVWIDPRLSYAGLEHGDCFDHLKMTLTGDGLTPLKSEEVWTPNLYFDNAKTEFYGSYYFWLEPTGKILRSILVKHSFECKMEFDQLPFDHHPCPIRLLSYTETSAEVTLEEKDGAGITLNKSGALVTEWSIQSCGSEVIRTKYGTGANVYFWDSMRLDIKLSRTAIYHLRTDVFYTLLFIIMTYCGFFIHRSAAPARVTIAVIPVLTIVNLLNHIDSQLPRIKTSWLSLYLTSSLVFSVIAVMEYGFVWMLITHEETRKERLTTLQALARRLVEHRGQVRAAEPEQRNWGLHRRPGKGKSADGEQEQAPDVVVPTSEGSGNVPGRRDTDITQASLTSSRRCLRASQEAVFTSSYRSFDPEGKGLVTEKRMHFGLRSYNLYYTSEQIKEIFETMGVAEGDCMSKETFIDYLVQLPQPAASKDQGFLDRPLSLCLDLVTRFLFLPSYMALLLSMGIWAGASWIANTPCSSNEY